MTIQVDYRTGSAELAQGLRSRHLSVEVATLAYGDVCWLGNGPEGCPVPVGVEFKQVMDVLKCITDGRFAGHQLPGLINTYQVVWLLVEGRVRPDMHTGVLQRMSGKGVWVQATVGQRAFMYKDYVHWMQSIINKGNILVQYTYDRNETLYWLHGTYTWWTAKEWEEHRGHIAMHTSNRVDGSPRVGFVRPSLVRRMAAELPGVGYEKSAAVAAAFPSVEDMLCATKRQWEGIPGVGKVMADRIWRAIHNG